MFIASILTQGQQNRIRAMSLMISAILPINSDRPPSLRKVRVPSLRVEKLEVCADTQNHAAACASKRRIAAMSLGVWTGCDGCDNFHR